MSRSVKVVNVGDGAVGKTCLFVTLSAGRFPAEYIPTVFDNMSYHIELAHDDGKKEQIRLALYDTAGQEDYDRLRSLSYDETNVFILCFAIDNRTSLKNISEKWAPEIKEYMPEGKPVPMILCGTKGDLRDDEATRGKVQVTKEDAEAMAKKIGAIRYFETSALKMTGLNELFDEAGRSGYYYKWPKRAPGPATDGVAAASAPAAAGSKGAQPNPKQAEKGCCTVS